MVGEDYWKKLADMQTQHMTKLEIAKLIIKQHFESGDCGLFDTRNFVGDPMTTIYSKDGLQIDICYRYSYFEVFGLNDGDFEQLARFYGSLSKEETTMERTTTVDSLEELCDMMCNNQPPKEKEQWWVFTFGSGQEHAGYYVKIWGTFASARNKMFEKYDNRWGFQYSWEEWEKMLNDPYRYWLMEEELEVIE